MRDTQFRRRILWHSTTLVLALTAMAACGNIRGPEAATGVAKPVSSLPESPTGYYAVFMASNNVVLYGRLEHLDSEYVTLRDVHYIRSNVDRDKREVSNQIVRRSHEWHNPPETVLHTRHIMIIEPVAENSRVIGLIRQMK